MTSCIGPYISPVPTVRALFEIVGQVYFCFSVDGGATWVIQDEVLTLLPMLEPGVRPPLAMRFTRGDVCYAPRPLVCEDWARFGKEGAGFG